MITKTKIITTAAIKGGTGKTTTGGVLAQAAVKNGKKALAVDLDPQANLTYLFNADATQPGSYEAITGARQAADVIQKTACGVDIMTANANLTGLKTSPGSARRLEAALEPLKGRYDLIMIDTAPTLGEGQNNALFASTGLLIPLLPNAYSLQALYQIADIAEHVRESKPDLQIIGAIITQYDARANLTRFMRDKIAEVAAGLAIPYLGEIRKGIAVEEAAALQQSLFEYAPNSKPAQDYMALYEAVTL